MTNISFQLLNGLASIEDVISYRDNIDLLPESAVKHIEETWSNLRSNYHEIINDSKRLRQALETVCHTCISHREISLFRFSRNLNYSIYNPVIPIVRSLINVNRLLVDLTRSLRILMVGHVNYEI